MFLPIFREMPDLRSRSASSRQEIWHFSKREQAYLFFVDFSLLSVKCIFIQGACTVCTVGTSNRKLENLGRRFRFAIQYE